MDQTQRDRLEARLIEERERAMSTLDRVDDDATIVTDDDGDLTRYPLHPADEGTDTMEQETAMVLLTQESERLALIDAALLRLLKEPETFGICEGCGQPIPFDRLDFVPWTQLCLECQTSAEGAAAA